MKKVLLAFVCLVLSPKLAVSQNTFDWSRQNTFPWNVDARAVCRGEVLAEGRVINFLEAYRDSGARNRVNEAGSNNYGALRSLRTALKDNVVPTLVYFPNGTYEIKRYKISGTTKDGRPANSTRDIDYVNLSNVRFIGCGSTIKVQGGFRMTQDELVNVAPNGFKMYKSYSSTVIPFEFVNSSRFSVEWFRLDGSLPTITSERSSSSVIQETDSSGFSSNGSREYRLVDVESKHFAADGFYIGKGRVSSGVGRADYDVLLDRIRSRNNARLGINVVQAVNVSILNSVFNDTGRTLSPGFAALSPSSGIDIEPNAVPGGLGRYDVDRQTSNILIDRTVVKNNLGVQISTNTGAERCLAEESCPSMVGSVTITNSEIVSPVDILPHAEGAAVILSVNNGALRDSEITLKKGSVYTFWGPDDNLHKDINTELARNKIVSFSDDAILKDGADRRNHGLSILDNTFRVNNISGDEYAIYIFNSRAVFSGNRLRFLTDAHGSNARVLLAGQTSTANKYSLIGAPLSQTDFPTIRYRSLHQTVAREKFLRGIYRVLKNNTESILDITSDSMSFNF